MVCGRVARSRRLNENLMNTWGWPYKAGPWLYGVGDIGRVSAAQNARGRELYLVI